VPVKTLAMLLPVLRRPALSLSSQAWRFGAGSAGISAGAVSALGWVVTCTVTFFGASGTGFFLKKLNIKRANLNAYKNDWLSDILNEKGYVESHYSMKQARHKFEASHFKSIFSRFGARFTYKPQFFANFSNRTYITS
jgi:hypothetical protein